MSLEQKSNANKEETSTVDNIQPQEDKSILSEVFESDIIDVSVYFYSDLSSYWNVMKMKNMYTCNFHMFYE